MQHAGTKTFTCRHAYIVFKIEHGNTPLVANSAGQIRKLVRYFRILADSGNRDNTACM